MTFQKMKLQTFSKITYFLFIGFIFLLHVYYLNDYMSFQDTSWVFAIANQIIAGKKLYRDVVWSVGPLPIVLEYWVQLIKPGYVSSVMIGLILKISLSIFWFLIFKRYVNFHVASAAVIFLLAQNNVIYFSNWSTSWEIVSVAFLIWSILNVESNKKSYLIAFGLGALLFSRQSSFVVVVTFFLIAIIFLFIHDKRMLRSNAINIDITVIVKIFALIVASVFVYMWSTDIFGPYIYEVFISAADKKGVNLLHGVLDAFTGGGAYLTSLDFSIVGVLKVNLAPLLTSMIVILFLRGYGFLVKNKDLIFLFIIIIAVLLSINFDVSSFYLDYSRVFVICASVVYIFDILKKNETSYDRCLMLIINMVAIASVFSYELSHPGRGWGNYANIFPVALLNLFFLVKNGVSRKFSISILTVFVLLYSSFLNIHNSIAQKINPFSEGYKTDYISGAERIISVDDSVGKIKMPKEKDMFIKVIRGLDISGKSCFVYATEPILYNLFNCNNPTNVYMVIGDFMSSGSAKLAAEKLISNPPCFLITRKNWLAPIDEFIPDDTLNSYEPMGRAAQFYMHQAISNILPSYDMVFDFKSDVVISKRMSEFYGHDWEALDTHRVYKNKLCHK
jgi:hypothetical protein